MRHYIEDQARWVAHDDPGPTISDLHSAKPADPFDLCGHIVGLNVKMKARRSTADVLQSHPRQRSSIWQSRELGKLLDLAGL